MTPMAVTRLLQYRRESVLLKVSTTRFGEIEIEEKDVIMMPSGLSGVPELKHDVRLDHDEHSPCKWLQA